MVEMPPLLRGIQEDPTPRQQIAKVKKEEYEIPPINPEKDFEDVMTKRAKPAAVASSPIVAKELQGKITTCDPEEILKELRKIPRNTKDAIGYNQALKELKEEFNLKEEVDAAKRDFLNNIVRLCQPGGPGIPIAEQKSKKSTKSTKDKGITPMNCYRRVCLSKTDKGGWGMTMKDCFKPDFKKEKYDDKIEEWEKRAAEGCELGKE